MENRFDIAFIGGGRLDIGVFSSLVESVKAAPGKQALKMIWIHDGPNFGGPAYDPDLSPSPLPFHQNIMDIEPNGQFPSWLWENRERIVAFIENANAASKRWLEHANTEGVTYREHLLNGDYATGSLKELRIPRAIYGIYLQDKMHEAQEKAQGIIDITFSQGSAALSASPEGGYSIALADFQIAADKVCLGIGMRPNVPHPQLENNPHYFANLYHEGSTVQDITAKIEAQYARTNTQVSVVVEGAGPAAMDLVNWIAAYPGLKDKVNLTVVSGHSRLRPPAEPPKKENAAYSPLFLNRDHSKAEALLNAIRKDIESGLNAGFSRPEVVAAILPHIAAAAQRMLPEEQQAFEEQYARFYIQNLVFDAVETVSAWQELAPRFIEGFYVQPQTAAPNKNGISVHIQSLDGSNTQTLQADLLINCTGGRTKINELTPQLHGLVQAGLLTPNPAGTGVVVDNHFQAREGLYVGGYTIKGSPPTSSGIAKGLEALGPAIDQTATTIAGHLNLERLLTPLRTLPIEKRGRVKLTDILTQSGLNPAIFEQAGIPFSAPVEDSYGRYIVRPFPEEMELLVVSLLPYYAPALHTHGAGTAGANLLCLDGAFYNVDYRIEDGVIRHDRIQFFEKNDVAYVSDNHIHRVVNLFDRPAMSLNVYWDNGRMPGNVGEEAWVFDAIDRTRVTTTGPAFFFRDGDDKQAGFQFSPMVQLEDIVFQHRQLSHEAATHKALPQERVERLSRLNAIIENEAFTPLLNMARLEAEHLIKKPRKTGSEDVTAQYFTDLFAEVKKITEKEIRFPEVSVNHR